MKDLVATLRPALVALLMFTALLGIAYPALMIGAARLIPAPPPSELVGQRFTAPQYFWGRPSAVDYNAMTSSGTNAGPTAYADGRLVANPKLVIAVHERSAALGESGRVPVDLVTASASGLDPDISPAAAYYQVARVARVRGLPVAQVRALVDAAIQERTLGVLGERRVNVVRLNRSLDAAPARQ